MAIQILRRGTPPEEITYHATCYRCKSQLSFLRTDGRVDSDYRNGTYVTIACPVCHHPVTADTTEDRI